MDGAVRQLALSSCSYITLYKVWGPMELNAVFRVIRQAMFDSWDYGVTVR